jgi:hypothetical protein
MKRIPNTDQEFASSDETISSKEETTQNYEVGYGKPPKETRFRKGTSGNPTGRPKKPIDFDAALLREAQSTIPITENGRKIHVSKHNVALKQLLNNAMKGTASAQRIYFEASRQAFQNVAQSQAEDTRELKRLNDPKELTTEELEFLALGGHPQEILRRRRLERERAKKGKPN